VNSPEDRPVGPKHVEISRYKIEIVTSVGFSFHSNILNPHFLFTGTELSQGEILLEI
jgi:hypothetical protein